MDLDLGSTLLHCPAMARRESFQDSNSTESKNAGQPVSDEAHPRISVHIFPEILAQVSSVPISEVTHR